MKILRGKALLDDPAQTKSTAFTRDERDKYGLRGLLPYDIADVEKQKERVLGNIRRQSSDIEKYIFLITLLERNQRLFYRTMIDHIEEIMPLVYTPTVGEACKEFAHIFRKPQGLYITPEDRGDIKLLLGNWPETDIRIIVVTDGERILGLGDLGANGMGIPIGKIALYIACAGIHPAQCMPVMLDVGTNNVSLREDPLYLGYPFPRINGVVYQSLVDEFVKAVQLLFPNALIQFEDFLAPNAFEFLDRYGKQARCFNDDIQGTAAVTLAGVYTSCRITRKKFSDLTIMFLGTGSAAGGIAELMVDAFCAAGLNKKEAQARLWFVDRKGLVVANREGIKPRIEAFAHKYGRHNFLDAISSIKPDVLIGATGVAGTFTEDIVRKMAEINEHPVIIALSNPTSHTECTAIDAYTWSDGRVIFASGSPFKAVQLGEKLFKPAQGNNAYIFPGVGLGVQACAARLVTQSMFLAAAEALANIVSEEEISVGAVYPSLKRIREVSYTIAVAVCRVALSEGLTEVDLPDDLETYVESLMYQPDY
ncbi:malate dehydrogenase (oxaloacetate-decarboxylating)(NADP+) [Nitrosomonas cryotolerans]|uniref:Malate dehydrogenase (Oxaloacetate-decarboxylating)(NADP+) n=1 Tax=Nitrosomonas cryotolerans ATCC 49181 TaxID=1131553 RepID=A0A1N6J0G9_9PROT|nr:NAD-dependent malic enzyme [Nitrosomonas cryotolerans]SFP54188.1 malate dehydrogenase (oxaloacetate-decarboxylating)(NADP+) [Nitrosomonas cryotolerans]SIO37733.1 malate dehydrogenase (oxaloacetate-decarboxylating)(NADP+) [Nitrosomonas cryotolerans ATCC 49181]